MISIAQIRGLSVNTAQGLSNQLTLCVIMKILILVIDLTCAVTVENVLLFLEASQIT